MATMYIGPGAKIAGNISIGENFVIGANAVATKDVPPLQLLLEEFQQKSLVKMIHLNT